MIYCFVFTRLSHVSVVFILNTNFESVVLFHSTSSLELLQDRDSGRSWEEGLLVLGWTRPFLTVWSGRWKNWYKRWGEDEWEPTTGREREEGAVRNRLGGSSCVSVSRCSPRWDTRPASVCSSLLLSLLSTAHSLPELRSPLPPALPCPVRPPASHSLCLSAVSLSWLGWWTSEGQNYKWALLRREKL